MPMTRVLWLLTATCFGLSLVVILTTYRYQSGALGSYTKLYEEAKLYVDETKNITNAWRAKSPTTKRILLYTTIYGSKLNVKRRIEVLESMSRSQLHCEWTTDKSLYSKSDAVVFHLYNNLNRKDFVLSKLPTRHSYDQLWVLMIQEPQSFYYPNQLKQLNNMFNMTVTFQSDSDIVIPYGTYEKLVSPQINKKNKNNFAQRSKLVVWLVSNCVTSSRREEYVESLKDFIDIDIYGDCSKHHLKGFKYKKGMASKYKFYLAFENADCDDYVTEKFWSNLMLGMIPIVRGNRVNYKTLAPPNSYIHADSFATFGDLAQHLHDVASNETLFNKYHKWRDSYRALFKPNRQQWMMELCAKLQTPIRQSIDVYKHFSENTRCFTYLSEKGRDRKGEHMEDITRL
ncbi:4-galactosyl-N-acetylglucosaminide 3-alpha-L-fucosyltransferase FUT6-like [Watersipora subatra]|uniref:4-galactosyl-N-acetylglucosaminide 3-alpha-L-fucosyltransferase FUT6-like n=1 Tax=Watersipora subatra TaxID=2589382 RepID=UPI00355C39FF